MSPTFYNLFKHIKSFYKGNNLKWQIVIAVSTYLLVASGFDWCYYQHTRDAHLQSILFTSALAGFLVPVVVPLCMLLYAKIKKSSRTLNAVYAVTQAGVLGLAISSFYKVFTGRPGPHHILGDVDISHVFRFGVLRGGAFQGWPSSHTSVAFAMSMALCMLYPEKKALKYGALIYAVYIGVGVSGTIHWFSDFTAGAILGSIIGITVGKGFYERYRKQQR